jgi:uncharacterized membrane protein YbhN (UPF0104 family)
MRRSRWRNLCAYCVAALLIWYSARGVHPNAVVRALRHANLKVFIPASLAGFLVWFFGENLLFARLFSYFHRRTGFRELLPANAAYYFLQLANLALANGALLLFLNRRKSVPWSAGGFTLLFQGLLDATLLAAMTLAAVLLGLESPLRVIAPYAAVVMFAGLATAGWFLWWRPRSRAARWVYERPALSSFRSARPSHYARLAGIRVAIFVADGFILFAELRSFHVRLSLYQGLLFAPVSLLVGSLPLAPVGLGTLQFVMVRGLSEFAARSDLLAAALAISFINLIWRIPLGLLSVGSVAGGRAAAAVERSCAAA